MWNVSTVRHSQYINYIKESCEENSTWTYSQNWTDDYYDFTLPTDYNKRDSLYIAIPLTILYTVILIAGTIGNFITCFVILKNKYLHTATNYYLFSLAVSDFLLLTTGLPQEIFYLWWRYPYMFGETFCVLRGLIAEMSTNASVLTITAFTVERYVAICHPFYAHQISNLSRAIKFVIAIWLISFLFAVPESLQFGLVQSSGPETLRCTLKRTIVPYSFEFSTLFFFVIPMIAITILYICIGIKLRSSAKLKQRSVSKPILGPDTQQSSSQRLIVNGHPSRKVVKMLVAVVITFFVCWAPFHVQRLVAIHDEVGQTYVIVTYISAILYYTSPTVNPILYHTMSHKFRHAFEETVGNICFRKYERTDRNNSRLSDRRRSSQIMYPNTNRSKFLVPTSLASNTNNRSPQVTQENEKK